MFEFYLETETIYYKPFMLMVLTVFCLKFCIIFLDKLQQTFRRNCQASGTFDFDDCAKFVIGRKGQQSSIFAGILGRIRKYLRLVLFEFFWIIFDFLYFY